MPRFFRPSVPSNWAPPQKDTIAVQEVTDPVSGQVPLLMSCIRPHCPGGNPTREIRAEGNCGLPNVRPVVRVRRQFVPRHSVTGRVLESEGDDADPLVPRNLFAGNSLPERRGVRYRCM